MLQVDDRQNAGYAPAEAASFTELVDFFRGVVRQQFAIIAFIAVIAIGLGALYLYITPPTFTARATMIIDRGKVQAQLGGMSRELPVDTVEIDSQIQLIKSEAVALAVVEKYNLAEDPEFVGPPVGVAGWIHKLRSSLLQRNTPALKPDPVRSALVGLASRLTVNRVGASIMEIEFQSLHTERAVEIANAFADSYLKDQLSSRYAAARQASAWLQDRIQELGNQISLAEENVVQFKAKNNIVVAGGRLINDQQLAELNTQLVLAREKTAETRARLDRIETIIRADSPDKHVAGTVSDTLNNPVIIKLRSQYLELANREADWSRRFGKDHLAVVNLTRQIREIRGSIGDELRRIAETYRSDYAIAKQRQAEIEKAVAETVSRAQVANQAQIELRQLESAVETYRSLYKSALQRSTELVQQQSFPGSEARLITRAAIAEKASPKTLAILFVSMASGLLLGLGVGTLRVLMDPVLRTSTQVESALQTPCLALAPILKPRKPKNSPRHSELRTIMRNTSVIWEVVDRPFSRFAEAMRSIKSGIDLSRPEKTTKVIGFTSSLPNEGKSTISSAFALLAAQAGARTILIDCDLRNPALTAVLAPRVEHGILDVISGTKPVDEALWKDPTTGLAFLPGAAKSRIAHSSEILSSSTLSKFFGELRDRYDYIVVDLPPVAPIVDVQSTAGFVDSYVFVTEWARTKTEVAEHALRKATVVQENLVGVVLNKVNFKLLGRYDGHRGDYYSDKYYAQYGDASRS